MSLLLLWPSSGTVCPPWTLSTSASFLVSVKLLCSLSILSVFLLYFLTSPRLLYDLRVSFLPTFFPLSEANLCYPSHLQTSCYFLLWGSFRRSSNLSSSARLLCSLRLSQLLHFFPSLSKAAMAAFQFLPSSHWGDFGALSVFLPVSYLTHPSARFFWSLTGFFWGCFSLPSRFMASQQLVFFLLWLFQPSCLFLPFSKAILCCSFSLSLSSCRHTPLEHFQNLWYFLVIVKVSCVFIMVLSGFLLVSLVLRGYFVFYESFTDFGSFSVLWCYSLGHFQSFSLPPFFFNLLEATLRTTE